MKLKKLLLFIPFVLALSSCGNPAKVGNEIKTNTNIPNNAFLEDTTLHEELFKGTSELKVRKNFTPVEVNAPAIGVQTKIDTNDTVGTEDDTISIRFVAAVTINGDLGSATAIWTRAMFNPNGEAFKATATKACTSAYTALATDNEPYTINDYNNASGGSYTHFVAYTMRNIPLDDYSSFYFTAFLTLNDGSGEAVSKVVATTVDQTTQFSFSEESIGYFAIKRTDSGFETITNGDFDNNEHYHADFEGMAFTASDSFLIVNRSLNHFAVFGYDAAHIVDPLDSEFVQLGSSQFLDCRYERTYFIHLNEYNRISVEEAFNKTLYFKPNSNWNDGSSKYVITLKHDNESAKRVYEMNRIGETNTYQCDCLYTASMLESAPIAFYKLPSGNSLDLTDKPHSQNLGWPLRNDDMYTMNIDNDRGYWSLRTEADPVNETGNFAINELLEPVEIHTARQKEYLAYTGDYTQMSTSDYPDGNAHISDSLPVQLDFNFTVPNNKVIDHYSVIYGKEADLSDGYEKAGDSTTSISFYNPYLGKNYYKLVAYFTDSTSEESAIHNFYVDATNPRNLTIAGMTNCRDLGGKLLEDGGVFKQGLVYRTSGRNQSGLVMTDATTEEMINHLGVINEVYLAERGSSYACNIPGATLNNFYMDYSATDGSSNFSRNTEPLKKFFNFMADSNNYPVYFHCKIGTDRTGLCATMLCGLLGVPLNEIYQDYLFSNFGAISGKRYIGEQAGHDNILRYTEYIQSFSGETFKNKVYNALLSIGISRSTLNAVINNLTDGPRATGNDAGQLTAFGEQLTPHGVDMSTYDNSLYSDYPDKYYVLDGPSTSVSYTFNAPPAYRGQIVAYSGNGDSSTTTKLDYALGLSLDNEGLTIRDVTFRDAGMGYITTSYRRNMYYPVILGIADLSAGEHTIEINGRSDTMHIAGISILNASTAVDLGGGGLSGEDPRHVHDYSYDVQITTTATCQHAGERVCRCSCGDYYVETIAKLDHEWGEPVIRYAEGVNYPATQVYNCSSSCNTSALRWSAMDYNTDLSDAGLEVNANYIRFKSGSVENSGGSPSTGSHIVYQINVHEAIDNAGLAFHIQNTNGNGGNAPVFRTITGDSSMGAIDNGDGTFTTTSHRYGLRVNDVEYFLGDDSYGNQQNINGWFDWPVSFPLEEGVNTIDIFAYAGYRARLYEFQLTGFSHVENNHEHELGQWQYDNNTHWKECSNPECPNGEHAHFEEGYHSYGDPIRISDPTCTSSGSEKYVCSICGREEIYNIPALGHDWIEGEITIQPTCTQPGERTVTCSRCGAQEVRSVPVLGHSWYEGVITAHPTHDEDGQKTVTCTRCGAHEDQIMPAGHYWSNEITVPAGEAGQVPYYSSTCSSGHENRIRISAVDGTLAQGSSNKSGTPSGYIKLNSNGNSISYTFNYSGETTTAKIYQRAIFDSWTSTSNRSSSYSTNATGEQGCNFAFTFNGDYVDMSETKNTQYETLFENGIDTGLGSSYSLMADCLIGEIELRNGVNTFTYTRLASMNLLVHDYIIIIE